MGRAGSMQYQKCFIFLFFHFLNLLEEKGSAFFQTTIFFKHPTLGFLNTLSATTPPRPTADDGRKTPVARSRPTPVRQKAWWWQTAWESGSGAGGRQHGRMGRGKWESRVLGLGLDVGLG
ncbi:uncharacterized protein [Gossypium hirsutum]|uniref:Uncharacterized protein n=1 Tax=Gossypium hirsutum TaxID=3635 RepID=A0ABM3ABU5_GOSHI|nr:uncharacterized protein LOC107909438 [Gossypium hirsutum]